MKFLFVITTLFATSLSFAAASPSYSGLCMSYFDRSNLRTDESANIETCKMMNTIEKTACVGTMIITRVNNLTKKHRLSSYELPYLIIQKCAKVDNENQYAATLQVITDYQHFLDHGIIDIALAANTKSKADCFLTTYKQTKKWDYLRECVK